MAVNGKLVVLALFAVSALSYGVYVISAGQIAARPENVHQCENKAYDIVMKDFQVDKDLAPGASVTTTASFTPTKSGTIDKMIMSVYKGPVRLFTQTFTQNVNYVSGTEFTYIFMITLPSFVPHIFVNLKLEFYDVSKNELGCIAFDLNL